MNALTASTLLDPQKAVAISRDGTLVAVGSTNNQVLIVPVLSQHTSSRTDPRAARPQVAVLSYPSLEPAFSNIIFDGLRSESVYDVDFDDSGKFVSDGSVRLFRSCIG